MNIVTKYMKYCLILISIVAVSCSQESIKPQRSKVLDSLSRKFVEEATARGVVIVADDLIIYFDVLSKTGAAAGLLNTGEIVIDSTSLNWKINPESVVFHELGHKYLHSGHMDEMFPVSSMFQMPKPKSIMNSRFMYLYTSDREYYLNELFSN